MTQRKDRDQLFETVIPDMNDWPILKLSRNKGEFITEVINETSKKILQDHTKKGSINEVLAYALYLERARIKDTPWKVDPDDQKAFWKQIKHRLIKTSLETSAEVIEKEEKEILHDIVSRFAHEIAGSFKPSIYKFSTGILPYFFDLILNAWHRKNEKKELLKKELTINDKIHLKGDFELIRKLATKGTVVLVPTHFSNLDSIIMGWTIKAIGLPAFLYGAGLNLFNTRLFAFFMGGLGAFKVDRRKKNKIYLETLKTYSETALKKGAHTLFFPGGTRSRSGSIENKLKLGLLGAVIEAQRTHFVNGSDEKIFIVPAVINYHFVFEAQSLIDQQLKYMGKEQYIETDKYSSSLSILKFILKFFTASSDITVSYGKPMDIFGNPVNADGISYDKFGKPIDIKRYFVLNDNYVDDFQRDAEYTQLLSSKIIEQFLTVNVVFTSHLVAFTAFQIIKKSRNMDLYRLLRISEDDIEIDYSDFVKQVNLLRRKILELKEAGKIDTSPELDTDIDFIIEDGLRNLGLYHEKRPLKRNKAGNIITEDLKLLYYYHNRLEGYEFDKYIA